MAFDSQGCEPLVKMRSGPVNRGAMVLLAAPALAIGREPDFGATGYPQYEPMPSLRDSRDVLGMPTRGLHPWLSNVTAPPLRKE
jgi:hypothetical protein